MSTPTLDGLAGWEGEAAAALSLLETHRRSVEAFNAHDLDAVAAVYAPDAEVHDSAYPAPLRGWDAIREDYAGQFRMSSDARVSIRRVLVLCRTLIYELIMSGTNDGPVATPSGIVPATGRRYEQPIAVFAEADVSSRYRLVRRYYDWTVTIRQLGLDA